MIDWLKHLCMLHISLNLKVSSNWAQCSPNLEEIGNVCDRTNTNWTIWVIRRFIKDIQQKVRKIDRLQICLLLCELLNDADQTPTSDRRQSEDTLNLVSLGWDATTSEKHFHTIWHSRHIMAELTSQIPVRAFNLSNLLIQLGVPLKLSLLITFLAVASSSRKVAQCIRDNALAVHFSAMHFGIVRNLFYNLWTSKHKKKRQTNV